MLRIVATIQAVPIDAIYVYVGFELVGIPSGLTLIMMQLKDLHASPNCPYFPINMGTNKNNESIHAMSGTILQA
jgi:hypothetical protein